VIEAPRLPERIKGHGKESVQEEVEEEGQQEGSSSVGIVIECRVASKGLTR
jgi:hypothetical protein